MSFTRFLSGVDSRLKDMRTIEIELEERKLSNFEFLKKVISKLVPLSEKYSKELDERDLPYKIESSETFLSFQLIYKDGRFDLTIIGMDITLTMFGLANFYYCTESEFTAKDYETFNRHDWEDEFFEDYLKKLIKSFIEQSTKNIENFCDKSRTGLYKTNIEMPTSFKVGQA